ncbi:uncharacterized protein LOC118238176 isoform X1 [Cricetulus griseus]|uniref:uncharacterized protein LOC118238176 isoform X1 n=1 Tax=Cricetulus griseus TaxID=10029 RepID=UPI0015C3307E|nr:uncharacterized protein LOC118238176 isoform X1 [Cricetulus griseus]
MVIISSMLTVSESGLYMFSGGFKQPPRHLRMEKRAKEHACPVNRGYAPNSAIDPPVSASPEFSVERSSGVGHLGPIPSTVDSLST